MQRQTFFSTRRATTVRPNLGVCRWACTAGMPSSAVQDVQSGPAGHAQHGARSCSPSRRRACTVCKARPPPRAERLELPPAPRRASAHREWQQWRSTPRHPSRACRPCSHRPGTPRGQANRPARMFRRDRCKGGHPTQVALACAHCPSWLPTTPEALAGSNGQHAKPCHA